MVIQFQLWSVVNSIVVNGEFNCGQSQARIQRKKISYGFLKDLHCLLNEWRMEWNGYPVDEWMIEASFPGRECADASMNYEIMNIGVILFILFIVKCNAYSYQLFNKLSVGWSVLAFCSFLFTFGWPGSLVSFPFPLSPLQQLHLPINADARSRHW